MELILNLAWAVLAAAMLCSWLRFSPGVGRERQRQLVALAVLLVILFPVISVTDDLLAGQNPAEPDTSLRRDHGLVTPHSILPAVAMPSSLNFAASLTPGDRRSTPCTDAGPSIASPSLATIQNRPPPVA